MLANLRPNLYLIVEDQFHLILSLLARPSLWVEYFVQMDHVHFLWGAFNIPGMDCGHKKPMSKVNGSIALVDIEKIYMKEGSLRDYEKTATSIIFTAILPYDEADRNYKRFRVDMSVFTAGVAKTNV